jgi:predicted DNA-binding transcriptional regulator AlpA
MQLNYEKQQIKLVKEICTITGVSQAVFYRKMKEMEKS